jgi:dienelactone hydrolase
MARQGLPLAAVVSFHGALVTDTPAKPGSVKAKVLVEHGAADSFITPEQIAAFKAEMDQAGATTASSSCPAPSTVSATRTPTHTRVMASTSATRKRLTSAPGPICSSC